MRSKSFITKGILCCLALLMVFSFVGCKDEPDVDYTREVIYDNQYKNIRYYCQQGYDAAWSFTEGNDKFYLKPITKYADGSDVPYSDCGLVVQFAPQDNPSKVKYSIYSLKGNFMRATLGDILIGLVGKNAYKFDFNNLFLESTENTPRDAFVWNEDIVDTEESIDSTKVYYNKLNFQKVGYTFTVDGVDWKGLMLTTLASSSGGFFVITLETEASVWDTYYETMETMLKDFRLMGWETEK